VSHSNLKTGKAEKTAMKSYRILVQLLFLTSTVFSGCALAQSTIFNIPTTDTVSKGKAYFEFDFMPQVPAADASRTYMYNPRLVVGVPGKIEFGVNFPISDIKGSGSSSTYVYLQPNAKWKMYENERAGVAMAVGGLLNTPLNSRNIQDSWGYLYGLVSEKIKTGNYSPRFHAGFYGAVSANQDPKNGPVSFSGPRAGAILGYEQPVYKKVSFVADWFSGENNLGYFTPGISISLPANGLLNAGYSIGNNSWADSNAARNRYLFFYYGITF
jgi:hypothetical protein